MEPACFGHGEAKDHTDIHTHNQQPRAAKHVNLISEAGRVVGDPIKKKNAVSVATDMYALN